MNVAVGCGFSVLIIQIMTDVKSHGRSARKDTARMLIDHASVALVYLGIVATFAVASVIACLIWLLIW